MTPREIIYANLEHNNPQRPGLNFSSSDAKDWLFPNHAPAKRINDICCLGIDPSDNYQQKRWTKDDKEG